MMQAEIDFALSVICRWPTSRAIQPSLGGMKQQRLNHILRRASCNGKIKKPLATQFYGAKLPSAVFELLGAMQGPHTDPMPLQETQTLLLPAGQR